MSNQIVLSTLALIEARETHQEDLILLQNNKLDKNIKLLNEFINDSILKNKKILELLKNNAQYTLDRNIKFNLIASILVGMFCVLISILIANKISKPIVKLTNTALRIAEPDFKPSDFNQKEFDQEELNKRNDELGKLSRSLHKMTEVLLAKQSEFQRLNTELSASETYKNAIFYSAMDGIISVDFGGIITELNVAAETILHCVKKSVIGQSIIKFIDLDWSHINKNSPKGRSEYVIKCTSKKQTPIELTIVKIKNIVPESYTFFIRDLSYEKETEYQENLRNTITKILAFSSEINDALPKTMEIIANHCCLFSAEFWKVNLKKNTLQRHTIFSMPDLLDPGLQDYKERFFECIIPPKELFKNKVWMTKKIAYCDNQNTDIFYSEPLNKIIPSQSMIGVPLLFEWQIVGLLILFFQERVDLDEKFLAFMNPIANQLGPFIARINNQDEIIQLNQQLVQAARQGGMAEVATNILHNVGNVLNSVNISIHMLKDGLEKNHVKNLKQVSELIQANVDRLTEFINHDEKGKLVLNYLDKLSTQLIDEKNDFENEVQGLITNIEHIKNIISLQQKITGSIGFTETAMLADVIDDSIKINFIEGLGINIHKDYRINTLVIIDTIKVQQIIVNLLRNAKDALIESPQQDKKITISLSMFKKEIKDWVEIKIQDNGCGILPENLTNVFNFGFTTKKTGHGFGLHASIIAAKELGGDLIPSSKGTNQGATFALRLPVVLPFEPKITTKKTLLP